MFEPFKAAPSSAQIANALILFFLFLSWVSTMVTFGSVLHRVSDSNYDLSLWWDHWSGYVGGVPYYGKYDDTFGESVSGGCKSGGEATLAFAIFAFLAFLLLHIPLAFCRMSGLNFPLARDTQHSLYIELVLSAIELFCFFLQTAIWGGSCFSPSRAAGNVTGVGYGLIIACFFFLVINTLLYLMMRTNDNLVMGNGATRGGGGSSGAYSSDPAGADYGADSASQPTFSYQGNSETAGSSL